MPSTDATSHLLEHKSPSKPSAAALRAGLQQLLELCVEAEQLGDSQGVGEDARIYRELFELDGAWSALTSILQVLDAHQAKRHQTIMHARIATCVHEMLAVLPDRKVLPSGVEDEVRKIARRNEVPLSDEQVDKILAASKRQHHRTGLRATRIFHAIMGNDAISDRTVSSLMRLKNELAGAAKTEPAGKVKRPEQLDVRWHVGVGASACLYYVLDIFAPTLPAAARRARKAWTEALRLQLEGEVLEDE